MSNKISLTHQQAPPPEKSESGKILPQDRAYLDSQREKANTLINRGGVRNIFLNDLARIYTTYFEPEYLLDTSNPDRLTAMLKDLYKRYDEILLTEQAGNAGPEKNAQ